MKKEVLKKQFLDYITKGIDEGLNVDDYHNLKRLSLKMQIHTCETLKDEISCINNILNILYNNDIVNRFSKETIDYMKKSALLLPLVLANNSFSKINPIFNGSYLFLCQFHEEKNPSFCVNDVENYGHCFGCNKTVDSITYISEYEHIKFSHAVELLASIYLIDIDKKSHKDNLIHKYQDAILSDEYKELLDKGYKKVVKDYGETDEIIDRYRNRYETISRIKNNIHDQEFVHNAPVKQYVLTREDIGDFYDDAKKSKR